MRVSIITPSFNRVDLIEETAQSVFAQSYADWEWMIVDDGSTDGAYELALQFAQKDKRVKVSRRERLPKGAASCRNIAVEHCTGDYVFFLDTDDILAPFCVQQRAEAAMQYPQADVLAFQTVLFKHKPYDMHVLWNIENEEDDVTRLLYADPVFSGSGTLWKKDSFVRIGGWNESLVIWQDVDLHLRAYANKLIFKKCLHLPGDLHVRVSETSISRTGYNTVPKLQSRIQVFTKAKQFAEASDKFEKYKPAVKSMFLTIFENAVNAPQFAIGKTFLDENSNNGLLTPGEVSLLKMYILMRKMKMYKVPPLQRYFEKRINALRTPYKKTLCSVPYQRQQEAGIKKDIV